MKLRILSIIALLVTVGMFVSSDGQVQAAATVTPEVIARIKARCVENQGALNRLHQTDAFLRNDRGNLYRTISDKLMVPLNRRLAANQLDGGALLTITSEYNNEYTTFFRAYIDYDNSLSQVLDIDCNREPVSFYNALLDAREKRAALSASNLKLKDLVRQYGESYASFKSTYEKENP